MTETQKQAEEEEHQKKNMTQNQVRITHRRLGKVTPLTRKSIEEMPLTFVKQREIEKENTTLHVLIK